MKRRQFSQFIALLAGGAALPAIASITPALKCVNTVADAEHLSRDFFEARVGKEFNLAGPDSHTLVLRGVENACGPACREQFYAVFDVSPGAQLKEGVFELERRGDGRFDLFLTESAYGKENQQLVAIINRQPAV